MTQTAATGALLCCGCFTARYSDEPDMDPDYTWKPGTCDTCGTDGIVFRYAEDVA